MKLAIISHTEHYKNKNGEIVGWIPTVREIDYLFNIFDEIYHCAPLYETQEVPESTKAYEKNNNFHFVPLKTYGGDSLREKISVLTTAPFNLKQVKKTLKKVDVFQFRAPTGMGVYMIPYLRFFTKKPGWFKYAGNWVQENAPWGYRIQRKLLKIGHKRNKVTINGRWKNQASNFYSFENPCLYDENIIEGNKIIQDKDYSGKLNMVFIGRLQKAKGVGRILDMLAAIDSERIGEMHFIGGGEERKEFEDKASEINKPIYFHGFLGRDEIFDIVKKCHFILLPSDSEGFPKVIAEGGNYGCIPAISNIPSITQYIKDNENGFVADLEIKNSFIDKMKQAFSCSGEELKEMAEKAYKTSSAFSFSRYNDRIKNEIVGF